VPAGLSEWQIAELIEDHEVDAGKIVCDAPLPAGARLGLEPIDEVDSDQEAAVRSRPDAASRDGDCLPPSSRNCNGYTSAFRALGG